MRIACKEDFRVTSFSVQSDHVHMIVEATNKEHLARGMRGLASGMARRVNRALGIRGSVWGDRYHRHDLTTPREVRNALVYVLQNGAKHHRSFAVLDPFSSAAYFDGWASAHRLRPRDGPSPVARPRFWLLTTGWKRRGLLRLDERPAQCCVRSEMCTPPFVRSERVFSTSPR